MATGETFWYEIAESEDEDQWKTTTVTCHGRLVNETTYQIEEAIKPLIQSGGHIRIDLTDLAYLDSSGLGALVGLKVSAIHKGYCKLELVNLSPKVKQLLTVTNLLQIFSQQ